VPLYPDASERIRMNLILLMRGQRVPHISIGQLTAPQLAAIQKQQIAQNLMPSVCEIVFVGRHIYQRRILSDHYIISDVLLQIESALSELSEVVATTYMTLLRNPVSRIDRSGNLVHDEAILECTRYRPTPELFSVIPKGDKIRP